MSTLITLEEAIQTTATKEQNVRLILKLLHEPEFKDVKIPSKLIAEVDYEGLLQLWREQVVSGGVRMYLEAFNMPQLRLKAQQLHIGYYSRLTKDQLIEAIEDEWDKLGIDVVKDFSNPKIAASLQPRYRTQ